MSFTIQVRHWSIRVVWLGINQSRTRILKDILNSENCYVIYLLRIIDIQIVLISKCTTTVKKLISKTVFKQVFKDSTFIHFVNYIFKVFFLNIPSFNSVAKNLCMVLIK